MVDVIALHQFGKHYEHPSKLLNDSVLFFLLFVMLVSLLIPLVWFLSLVCFVRNFPCIHFWQWELCVRRSCDRGSAGSPLGGVPQDSSSLANRL